MKTVGHDGWLVMIKLGVRTTTNAKGRIVRDHRRSAILLVPLLRARATGKRVKQPVAIVVFFIATHGP